MIPAVISPHVKSSAERRIYYWFKNDPQTKEWIVFHSLGIENHITAAFGEVDFFVLAPDLGVFALEVKGGRVSRSDGMWVFNDKDGDEHKKSRGPFEQASEGMYSIKNEIAQKSDKKHIEHVLAGYGVMFPDITYDNEDIDVAQEMIFDERDGEKVAKFVKRLAEYFKNKYKEKGVKAVPPDKEDIKEIAELIRGDFDKGLSLSAKFKYAEDALLTLTNEQYRIIDGLSLNKRVLVTGPAGTGKTVLAIKNAREEVINGKKVGVFCYNVLLANELEDHFNLDPETKPAYVGSLPEYVFDLIKKHKLHDLKHIKNPTIFYKEELPLLAIEAIELEGVKFGKIIIDEAQDLITDGYLMIIDSLIDGGLKNGEWYFFGDFEYQTIFNENINTSKAIDLIDDVATFATYKLTINCRNTINIQREMNKLFNMDISTLNKDQNMPPVQFISYSNKEEELELLEEKLKELIANKITPTDITILSPFTFEDCVASKVKRYFIDNTFEQSSPDITFATIQGFKGIENSVVILADIESYSSPSLMYTGMSRARIMLIVFESKWASKMRKKMMEK